MTIPNSSDKNLQANSDLYCELVDDILFPVVLSSVHNNRCLYMNQRAVDLFEFSNKNISDNVITEFYVEPQNRQELVNRLKAEGSVRNYETLLKTGTGRTFCALVSSTLTIFQNELAVCSVFNDVTERKRAENKLSDAHRRLDQIIDFLPDATFIIDKEGKVIAWNKASEEMTGVARKDIIGRGDQEYALAFYGERRMLLSDLILLPDNDTGLKQYNAVQNNGNVIYGETYVPKAYNNRGAYLWVTASLLRDSEGKVIGAIESLRDITERRHTEKLLKDSESKYRNIFENASEGIFQSTIEGRYISLNPAFARIRGYGSPEEMINMTGDVQKQAYVHPEDRLKLIKLLEKQGFVSNYEAEVWRKDGSIIWVSINARPIRDGHGKIILLEGTIQDITERKEAEGKLRESEEIFRKLFENHAAVKLLIDADTSNILDANEAAVDFYGWTREQLQQMKIQDINTLSPEQIKREMEKVRNSKRVRFEFQHRRADGSIRDVEVLSSKIDIKGKQCLHSIINDITERKRAEKALQESEMRYRMIFESSLDAFFLASPDGSILSVNPAGCRMFGRSQNEICSLNRQHLLDEEDPHLKPALEIRAQNGFFNGELTGVRSTGEKFPLEVSSTVFTTADGQSNIAIIARDITERKRIEEELLRAQKLESLGVLAGGIAHDFNNLMTMVQGYIELTLLDLPADHSSRQRLLAAMDSVAHTRDLTSKLITFSRGGQPHKEISDVAVIIRNAVMETVQETNILAEFDFMEKLYPAEIDELQMKQVFYNLTANACEAMPNGGKLTIKVENTFIAAGELPELQKAGTYLKITFTDEGAGIPEEHLPRIFDPYFTTKKMAARKGLGLGLAVCYSVLKKHGGHITVETKPGKGASFVLYIPAGKDIASEKEK